MKKTILALTVAFLGTHSVVAMADEGSDMFAKKKTASAVVADPFDKTKNEKKHTSQSPNIEKVMVEQYLKVGNAPRAARSETKAKVGGDTKARAAGEMFGDNGVYDDVRFTPKDPAININDKTFYKLLTDMDKVHATRTPYSDKNQNKLKLLDYKVYELAEKGNENAIDYLCLNPKESPYIQVSTMKYYCNLASINGHAEFLGFRAWKDNDSKVKVGNYYTNKREHDHLSKMTLDKGASWAYMLEDKRMDSREVTGEVHQKLHDKQSFHWLHYKAVDDFHKTHHPH